MVNANQSLTIAWICPYRRFISIIELYALLSLKGCMSMRIVHSKTGPRSLFHVDKMC